MGWGMRVSAVTALIAFVLVPAAQARPQTTAPNVYVNIHVTLTDTKIIFAPKSAPRGADARFIVSNIGTKPQTFTLGSSNRGLGIQTGFSRVIKPKEHQVLLLYLNARGTLPYYSGLKASKALPAMKGIFVVGAQCALCVPDD
jgi:hypothetical protein